ncbi:MAG: FtsX-like permease family protein, partial [Acidobacteriota bacterium]
MSASETKRAGRPRLLLIDLRRSWGRLLAAGLGVALAAAVLTFLLGLGRGIENAVVGELAPPDRIEVAARSAHIDLGPLRMALGSEVLGQEDLKRLQALEGVAAVWPRVGLAVPAVASGGAGLLGQSLVTELAVEGIDPALLGDELGGDSDFVGRPEPGPEATPCWSDRDCPTGEFCLDTVERKAVCRPPVPVVVSEKLIGLYNGSIRRAYGLPRLNPEAAVGLGADVQFGASSFSASARRGVLRDRLQLVGFSNRAMPLGVTLPLEEVQRLNAYFGDGDRRGGFDTVTLGLKSGRELGSVTSAVRQMGYRVVQDDMEKMAAAVSVATVVMALVGLAVVCVAALGVVHTFALLVDGRRREIGILRSIGAAGLDVALLFLTEAALVGLGGG